MASGPAFMEEQERWKHDALQNVRQQGHLMKRALDANNLRDALKHSSNMISELRTSLLSPKNYYELYMTTTDELRYLEAFFADDQRLGGRRMLELYELVQHAGNILPRLYLLVTVGATYIKSKQAPARDILKDLVEMCRGVQHPLRGLFLRNYLSQMSKDKLPDTGSEYEGKGGTVDDAIEFVLCNFVEMNKLWVRIQHQGPVRERERREKERQELRILVGTNLVRLSQLEGIDADKYATTVLPRILEQVVNCKDQIAQHYLMECIIQVFPDEFHLRTLEPFLEHVAKLQPGVDVKGILVALLQRLGAHAAAAARAAAGGGGDGGAGTSSSAADPAGGAQAIPDDVPAFALLTKHAAEVVSQHGAGMAPAEVVQLHGALVGFALKAHPERRECVDEVFAACVQYLGSVPRVLDAQTSKLVTQLLVAPLGAYGSDALGLLELRSCLPLRACLKHAEQKAVAIDLVRAIIKHDTVVRQHAQADQLLAFIEPLICAPAPADGAAGADDAEDDEEDEDFQEEQGLVCRLLHFFRHEDTDQLGRMLDVARAHLGKAGPRRTRRTMVPLVLRCVELAMRIHARATAASADAPAPPKLTCKKMFEFVHRTISDFPPEAAGVALRLHLQAAQAADACALEQIAYEFVTQAFILFEDELSDSKAQGAAIAIAVGTLRQMRSLSAENYETLAMKATQYSAKLLKKPDQCRAVARAAHLFWAPTSTPAPGSDAPGAADADASAGGGGGGGGGGGYTDGKRVRECLQRALKTADACKVSNQHVALFVELLDEQLYYYELTDEVAPRTVGMLMSLIEEQLASTGAGGGAPAGVDGHYANVRAHIEARKAALRQEGNAEMLRRYDEIDTARSGGADAAGSD